MPRKALLELDGRPAIAHRVEQAWSSQVVTDVVVSSDSHEILDAASKAGALALERPGDLAHERDIVVCKDVHPVVQEQWSSDYCPGERFVALLLQGMIFNSSIISRSLDMLVDGTFSLVRTVVGVGHGHPYLHIMRGKDGRGEYIYGDKLMTPSQNYPPLYCGATGVMGIWSDGDMGCNDNMGTVVIDEMDMIEPHDEFDWVVAQALYWRWKNLEKPELKVAEA